VDEPVLLPPMTSWSGKEDLESFKHLRRLENLFGGDHAIVVNTKQIAVQMCMEVMGSRVHVIPVAMPVTTSMETFAGVLYSGAVPVLLDVDTSTQQVRLDLLQDLLEEGEGAVVLLDRAGGYPVPANVLEAVQDVPTIAVTRCMPTTALDQLNLDATFNIFDLSEVTGSGAVIFHKFEMQQQELRVLRGGPLGHKAWLTEDLCRVAYNRLYLDHHIRERVYNNARSEFEQELHSLGSSDILLWSNSRLVGPLYFQVPDAGKMMQHLAKNGVVSRRTFYPLNTIPEVAGRMPNKDS